MLNHAEIRYDAQSRPLAFTLEARVKESPLRISTTIADGKATSEVIQDDKSQTVTHDVADTSLLLPNNVFSTCRSGRRAARGVETRRDDARVRGASGRDSRHVRQCDVRARADDGAHVRNEALQVDGAESWRSNRRSRCGRTTAIT